MRYLHKTATVELPGGNRDFWVGLDIPDDIDVSCYDLVRADADEVKSVAVTSWIQLAEPIDEAMRRLGVDMIS